MTIAIYRHSEPLYLVILKDKNANAMIQSWINKRNLGIAVDHNRMKFFDQPTFDQFSVTWPHGFHNITIWDCWNKRHIYQDT